MKEPRQGTRGEALQNHGMRNALAEPTEAVHTSTSGCTMTDTSERMKTPPKASRLILLFVIVSGMFFVLVSH
jgi:hypothetical protein